MSSNVRCSLVLFTLVGLHAGACGDARVRAHAPRRTEPTVAAPSGPRQIGPLSFSAEQLRDLEHITPFIRAYEALATPDARTAWVTRVGRAEPALNVVFGYLEVFAGRWNDVDQLAEILRLRKLHVEVYDERLADRSRSTFENRYRLKADYFEAVARDALRRQDPTLQASALMAAIGHLRWSMQVRRTAGMTEISPYDETWLGGRYLYVLLRKAEGAQRELGNDELADRLLEEARIALPPARDLQLRADHAMVEYDAARRAGDTQRALDVLERGIADVFAAGFPTTRYRVPLEIMIQLYRAAARQAALLEQPEKVDRYLMEALRWDFQKEDVDSMVEDLALVFELGLSLERLDHAMSFVPLSERLRQDMVLAHAPAQGPLPDLDSADLRQLMVLEGVVQARHAVSSAQTPPDVARGAIDKLLKALELSEQRRRELRTMQDRRQESVRIREGVDALLPLVHRFATADPQLAARSLWAVEILRARMTYEIVLAANARNGLRTHSMWSQQAWQVRRATERSAPSAPEAVAGSEAALAAAAQEVGQLRDDADSRRQETNVDDEVDARIAPDLWRGVPRDVTVLRFHGGKDFLAVWVLTAGELVFHLDAMPSSRLEQQIRRFNDTLLRFGGDAEVQRAGGALFRMLVPDPIRRRLPAGGQLLVIGDEHIGTLPFAALSPRRGRYLVDDYEIFYAPSLAVYLLQAREFREQRLGPSRFLGVGGIDYARYRVPGTTPDRAELDRELRAIGVDTARLARLPGARDELVAAFDLFSRRGRLLLDRDATPQEVRASYLTDYDVIHVAGHVLSSPRDASAGGALVLLSPTERSTGVLRGSEFLDLPSQSYLVTLSACDTGTGETLALEGTESLAQMLVLSGSDHVMATFWSVEDETARLLALRFYRGLQRGLRPAAALRRAQLWLRTQTVHLTASRGMGGSFASRISPSSDARADGGGSRTVIASADVPYLWAAFGMIGVNRVTEFVEAVEGAPLGSVGAPVKTHLPTGQRAYLDRLRCADGSRATYERAGNVGMGVYGNVVDAYDVRCPGSPATPIYMDMYFPGYRERRAPAGFTMASRRGP